MKTKSGIEILVGNQIEYIGKQGVIKSGIVEEVFQSMDKSFLCFWVKNELNLITDHNLLRKIEK